MRFTTAVPRTERVGNQDVRMDRRLMLTLTTIMVAVPTASMVAQQPPDNEAVTGFVLQRRTQEATDLIRLQWIMKDIIIEQGTQDVVIHCVQHHAVRQGYSHTTQVLSFYSSSIAEQCAMCKLLHVYAIQITEQECKKLKWGKTSGELTDV